MATPGHRARVRVSGDPVVFTDEATTPDGALTVYQITDAALRVWDRTAAITVERDDGGGFAVVPASEYTLDRLFGRVIFAAAQDVGDVVQVSGQSLPLTEAAEASELAYTLSATNQTAPRFGDRYMRRRQALRDVSGSLSAWEDVDEYFRGALTAGDPVVIEIAEDRDDPDTLVRMWAILSAEDMEAAADGLRETSVEFEGTADADGRAVSFAA